MASPTILEVLEDAIRDELRAYGIRGFSLISTPYTGSIRLGHDNGRVVYIECGDYYNRDPSLTWTLRLEHSSYNSYDKRWHKREQPVPIVFKFDLQGVDFVAMMDLIIHHLAEIDRVVMPTLMPHDESTGFPALDRGRMPTF